VIGPAGAAVAAATAAVAAAVAAAAATAIATAASAAAVVAAATDPIDRGLCGPHASSARGDAGALLAQDDVEREAQPL
jgi:hypothetical protein